MFAGLVSGIDTPCEIKSVRRFWEGFKGLSGVAFGRVPASDSTMFGAPKIILQV